MFQLWSKCQFQTKKCIPVVKAACLVHNALDATNSLGEANTPIASIAYEPQPLYSVTANSHTKKITISILKPIRKSRNLPQHQDRLKEVFFLIAKI